MKLSENEIRSLLLKEGIRDKILQIIDMTPIGRKYNAIYLIKTFGGGYVLKIVQENNPLMGEEDLFDMGYDSVVHTFVSSSIDIPIKPRRIISYSAASNIINSPYIILTLIEGDTGESISHDNLLTWMNRALEIMSKVYIATRRDYYGYPARDQLAKHGITMPIDFWSELNERQSKLSQLTFFNYTTRFFKNDIKREAPDQFKLKLEEYVNSQKEVLNIGEYSFVHADIKPKNLIINNDLNIIDWSRAHYGDFAMDIADMIITMLAYGGVDRSKTFTLNMFGVLKKEKVEEGIFFKERVKYYMCFKLFSIARVHYPELLLVVSDKLVSSIALDLNNFLEANSWVYGKVF